MPSSVPWPTGALLARLPPACPTSCPSYSLSARRRAQPPNGPGRRRIPSLLLLPLRHAHSRVLQLATARHPAHAMSKPNTHGASAVPRRCFGASPGAGAMAGAHGGACGPHGRMGLAHGLFVNAGGRKAGVKGHSWLSGCMRLAWQRMALAGGRMARGLPGACGIHAGIHVSPFQAPRVDPAGAQKRSGMTHSDIFQLGVRSLCGVGAVRRQQSGVQDHLDVDGGR